MGSLASPFQDKVIVITGGARGIGRALVLSFLRAGAKVATIDQNGEVGAQLADEIAGSGKELLFYQGDVSHPTHLEQFAQKVIATFNGVDCLINNAMTAYKGILSGCSFEDFTKALQIGVAAPYYLTKLFLPYFRPQASIVNMSSTRAFQSQSDTESYSAAKGGITSLTHALAVSLAGKVRVNSISPGWIDTGETCDPDYEPDYTEGDRLQHPSGRVGHPQDIVQAVMFLCDERNSFINGHNLFVDGGMSKRMIYTGDEGWTYNI